MLAGIVERIKPIIEPIVNKHNMIIDSLQYLKRGREMFLELYVEREDLSSIDLDAIVLLSDEISKKLDEVDLISENYTLDVSTSGAEKEIKDFNKFNLLIGKLIQVHVEKAIQGENIFKGILKEVNDDNIVIAYKIKTRTKEVSIEIKNITKANLAVNI